LIYLESNMNIYVLFNFTILIGCGLHVQCFSYIHFEGVCAIVV